MQIIICMSIVVNSTLGIEFSSLCDVSLLVLIKVGDNELWIYTTFANVVQCYWDVSNVNTDAASLWHFIMVLLV